MTTSVQSATFWQLKTLWMVAKRHLLATKDTVDGCWRPYMKINKTSSYKQVRHLSSSPKLKLAKVAWLLRRYIYVMYICRLPVTIRESHSRVQRNPGLLASTNFGPVIIFWLYNLQQVKVALLSWSSIRSHSLDAGLGLGLLLKWSGLSITLGDAHHIAKVEKSKNQWLDDD